MTTKTITAILTATMTLAVTTNVLAYEQGDFIFRVGAATVNPDDSSSLVTAGILGAVPNSGLSIDSNTQVGLTASYMLTDKLAIGILAATPFSHDVELTGNGIAGAVPALTNGTKIASIKHLPPTVSLQYFFLDATSKFQPYAGIGINYTIILDEDLSSGAEAVLGADDLDVDNSVGLSFQFGVDYQLNDKWLVNATVWNIDIDTEASFDSAVGKVKADLDIDPWVYMVSVGYKF